MGDRVPFTPAMAAALAAGRSVLDGTPEGIAASERRGQHEATRGADRLPVQLRPGREAFEALGFVFGGPVGRLFVSATFPEGWTVRPTDHAMWSDILDARGRKRGAMFYKAAFYDERADARLSVRYSVETLYPGEPGAEHLAEGQRQIVLRDAGVPVRMLSEPFSSDLPFAEQDRLEEAAKAAVEAEFPDHRDPLAYWD